LFCDVNKNVVILLLFYIWARFVIDFYVLNIKRPGPKPLKGQDTNIRKKATNFKKQIG
jgi:hypothetical protein